MLKNPNSPTSLLGVSLDTQNVISELVCLVITLTLKNYTQTFRILMVTSTEIQIIQKTSFFTIFAVNFLLLFNFRGNITSDEQKNIKDIKDPSSIQIIFRYLVDGLGACAHILHGNQRPRPTIFDFQEAGVAVGHVVGPANWVVVGRTYLLAASEEKAGDAPLHRHHEDVFPEMKIKLNSLCVGHFVTV